MCCFIVFVGYGIGLVQASANVVCGEMNHGTMMLNFLHACYGLGALTGPLIASSLLESHKPWNYTYIVLCALAIFNSIVLPLFGFRHLKIKAEREEQEEKEAQQQEQEMEEENQAPPPHPTTMAAPLNRRTSMSTIIPEEEEPIKKPTKGSSNILAETLRYRVTYVGALFLLLYVGTEVTIGNWGYTFLITTRSSDTVAMARIMSGYWAGICAGRLVLGYVTSRFGMLIVVWLVPFVGANATALVVAGVALGPIFPTTVAVANKSVPSRLYATTVGFLAAFGSGGSALFPYITGVLIGSSGIGTMPPFCMAMAIAMVIAWFFIPNPSTPTALVMPRLARMWIHHLKREKKEEIIVLEEQ
ncbi:hypothetical protein EC973_002896 [Apophysomyces ossiformis]|uniref:Uncharacterized protein n=1 Tax=Apophysomyces ossiformis TaxID=679940 RepID=A0A8H7EML5_9FUNG|nr:hypothetical protein EC973_002896 [Apophysomyces ossiformis]